MKLIGITGKAGSGKTTFSDILAENENIGVIHIDDILRKIKLKYFKGIMQEDKTGEKTKVNSKLKTMLYKNKTIFNLFMKFRAKLIEPYLKEEILKLEKEGKQFILIDDTFLQYQKCYREISQIIIVNRPFIERRLALEKREKLSKEEVVAYDIAHFKGNYKETTRKNNVIKINNNKNIKDLRIKAQVLYKNNFETMRNKYKVKVTKIEHTPRIKNSLISVIEREER